MEKEKKILEILNKCSINIENINSLGGLLIERNILLKEETYKEIQHLIPELKEFFSSSSMTSLHSNANLNQKWPLINFVRQLLKSINFKLTPIRKCDGYTKDNKKKYRRYFLIEKYKIIE
tara:strand:+ start:230 stop:589 length:360 start_codon:yes stop_codon:yes gene_type:complete